MQAETKEVTRLLQMRVLIPDENNKIDEIQPYMSRIGASGAGSGGAGWKACSAQRQTL
jgi:hypothetical protein